jgi:HD-like signal output (HDOD) protein/ActR/RegA family two-component response regulator
MRRVLFVDDDQSILDALRRLFRTRRAEWDMTFALGGLEALKKIEEETFDIVISDMRMPDVDGSRVLDAVRRTQPGCVRLVLSGHSTSDAALGAVGTAHQFIAKPCEPAELDRLLTRILSLRETLSDPAVRELVGGVSSLPSPPSTYLALVQALSDPETSIRTVAAIVERDPAVAAKVLQLVNSSFFGRARRVSSLEDAVSYLGMNLVRAVAISHEALRLFQPCGGCRFDGEAFQAHSLRVAGLSKRLMTRSPHEDDAFMTGILHDLGQLVLATRAPLHLTAMMDAADASNRPLHQIERDAREVTHAEVGGYLLGIWGLPHVIVEGVTWHHQPGMAGTEDVAVIAAVHAADVFDHEQRGEPTGGLDLEFLTEAGYINRLDDWRATAAEYFASPADQAAMDPT